MNLQTIINHHEAGDLLTLPDPVLEAARLEVEAAQAQARHLPTLANFRQTLFAIETSLTQMLIVRYGCDD